MDDLKVFSCFAKLGDLICINIYRDGKYLCGIDLTPSQADKLVNDIMKEQISLKDQEKDLNNFFEEKEINTEWDEFGQNLLFEDFYICVCGYLVKKGETCRKCGRYQ